MMDVTSREAAEYQALRQTIRERGTLRVWVALVGFLGWGALLLGALALIALPIATLLPLFVLAVSFEMVFSIHTAVERIGRYIQVFFEETTEARVEGRPAWEHQAMAFGQRFPGSAPDPLFTGFYTAATFLNFIPVGLTGGIAVEYISLGVVHLLFIGRALAARRKAGRQRADDLERFRELKRSKSESSRHS
jgi:hypothetical protein